MPDFASSASRSVMSASTPRSSSGAGFRTRLRCSCEVAPDRAVRARGLYPRGRGLGGGGYVTPVWATMAR